MSVRYDEHYVRAVVQMGDTSSVFTTQTIFTTNKIKLVDKGTRVNSALFERLVSHKLIPKLDQCLAVEDGVTPTDLMEYARVLLDNDPNLAVLGNDQILKKRLLRTFAKITLLPPMVIRLTVAQKQRPEVFDHSIRVALIALYLSKKTLFMTEKDLVTLATAAVFHDIGILHVSPELLIPGRRLKQAERHHLYAHPITGFLILREFSDYHPEISRAVLEHHERLDGSGYPRAIKEAEISTHAQILMLAEVANTVFERNSKTLSLAKLSVVLGLNHKKFNTVLANSLLSILGDIDKEMVANNAESYPHSLMTSLERHPEEIARIFQDWYESSQLFQQKSSGFQPGNLVKIIDQRIADLEKSLSYAGLQVSNLDSLIESMQDDPEALSELGILIDEVRWQLAEIIYETHRRIRESSQDVVEEQSVVGEWLERSKEKLQLID